MLVSAKLKRFCKFPDIDIFPCRGCWYHVDVDVIELEIFEFMALVYVTTLLYPSSLLMLHA